MLPVERGRQKAPEMVALMYNLTYSDEANLNFGGGVTQSSRIGRFGVVYACLFLFATQHYAEPNRHFLFLFIKKHKITVAGSPHDAYMVRARKIINLEFHFYAFVN